MPRSWSGRPLWAQFGGPVWSPTLFFDPTDSREPTLPTTKGPRPRTADRKHCILADPDTGSYSLGMTATSQHDKMRLQLSATGNRVQSRQFFEEADHCIPFFSFIHESQLYHCHPPKHKQQETENDVVPLYNPNVSYLPQEWIIEEDDMLG